MLADPDPVNHPPHYTSHPSGVECVDLAEHLSFNMGNALKYIWRAGKKESDKLGKRAEDLRKALWYVDRELRLVEVAEECAFFSNTRSRITFRAFARKVLDVPNTESVEPILHGFLSEFFSPYTELNRFINIRRFLADTVEEACRP